MPIDESVAYYWTSLGLSAAGFLLFLWLVRAPRPRAGGHEEKPEPPPAKSAAAPLDPQKASRADT
ncbi:MAG TPA: hypothetical protein VE007_05645 [Thermoanaerobaculia bacterium]|nr:hypothetical protein [Thermoanaerobaculia bacterium]